MRSKLLSALVLVGLALVSPLVQAEDTSTSSDEGSQARAADARLRILALGDSYTIGEGIDSTRAWPVLLAKALDARGYPAEPPEVVARTGWTTTDLARGMRLAELRPPYDLVTLMIGVNDQYQNYKAEDFPRRLASLAKRAIQLAGDRPERVLVVSIPDYGVTPFGENLGQEAISNELKKYNEIVREQAEAAGVGYADITPVSLQAGRNPNFLAPDGLHYSQKMYVLWMGTLLPLAEQALRGDTRPAP